MSRIGKIPINIPKGVEIRLQDDVIVVKGPKGSLSQKMTSEISVDVNEEKKVVTVAPQSQNKKARAQWGLYKIMVNNMIRGVTDGFSKTLLIEGIGYKAEMKGSTLLLSAGYSHPILYMPAKGITLAVDGPTKVIVKGADKQMVGQVAAEIRAVRPPEPYKGKGIRYEGEHIIRKAGKTGVK